MTPEVLGASTAHTPRRKSLIIALGTTGCVFADSLIEACPEMVDTVIGVDTAALTGGAERGSAPPWLTELPARDLRALVRSRLPFFVHEKWRELEYPPRVDHGAGATRLIGAALAAPEFPRIRQRIRQVLVDVLQDPPPSGSIQVLLVAGGGGGTGGALLSTVAYWVLVEAKRVAPGINVRVEIMLILDPYYHAVDFQGTERENRRLPANVAQVIREILWLQTPKNGAALQRALGIANPIDVPPVSALLPFGSDATGATMTRERLFPRMVATSIARNHPGISEVDRNLLANANVQMYGEFGPSERAILTADSVALAWLPEALGEYYLLTQQTEALGAALALPEAERIEGLKDSVKPRLGIDGIKGDIEKTLDELAPAQKTNVDPAVARKTDRAVREELLKIHKYYNAQCLPGFIAKAKAKAQENERQVIPEAVAATQGAILEQTASLPAAREVAVALAADLDEEAATVRADLGSIKQAGALGVFAERLAELKKNSLRIRKRRLRVAAGQACDAWMRDERDALVLKLAGQALKSAAHRLRMFAAEVARREASLRERLAEERGRRDQYQRAASFQSEAITSVVAPGELDEFIDKVARGIDDKLGSLASPLAPAKLMGSDSGAILEEFAQATRNRYATFMRYELKSLSGAVAFGRLRFALGPWAAAAAARIALPLALDFLPIGGEANAPCHRYIAAPAMEHTVLSQAKSANPALRPYQIEDNGGDPFIVAVRYRYAGLPVRTLSSAPEYEVAIAEVERLDQSKAVNVLWSSPEVEGSGSIRLAEIFEPQPSVPAARRFPRGNLAANDGELTDPLAVEA